MGTISLKNISKSFRSKQVLNNLNVDIKDVEFLILIGLMMTFIIAQKQFIE